MVPMVVIIAFRTMQVKKFDWPHFTEHGVSKHNQYIRWCGSTYKPKFHFRVSCHEL